MGRVQLMRPRERWRNELRLFDLNLNAADEQSTLERLGALPAVSRPDEHGEDVEDETAFADDTGLEAVADSVARVLRSHAVVAEGLPGSFVDVVASHLAWTLGRTMVRQ